MKNKTAVKKLMAIGYPRNVARKILSSKDSSSSNKKQCFGACLVAQQFLALDLPLSAVSGITLCDENGTLSVGVSIA